MSWDRRGEALSKEEIDLLAMAAAGMDRKRAGDDSPEQMGQSPRSAYAGLRGQSPGSGIGRGAPASRGPGPGGMMPAAPLTEEEKRRRAEALHRQFFGGTKAAGNRAIQTAAEGVGAGAEEMAAGPKNRGTSAAARAPEAGAGDGRSGSGSGTAGRSTADRAKAEAPEIPERLKTKPNKRENEFMMNLMILRNTLLQNGPAMRERAGKAGKWVWRDIRLATVLICRIQEALLRTMPQSRDDYYTAYAKHGHYELHMNGPIRTARHLLITDKHLAAICDAAMENECQMCMRDGKEIDRCMLREALLEVAAPTEIGEGDSPFRRCEYRDAAGQLILGKEVTI